ncbi:hypothetical protein BJY04DRAFT_185128 [Aspergillus karnatakaensis]|uniref:uncharacterized protein n=1 Tax=Aspergillus karnatakaensis TaxID=1810916 RepID=UPI003CCD9909
MPKASPALPSHMLGGVSLVLTVIVTIVDGVCYGSFRKSTPDSSLLETVTISLGIINCSVVLALLLTWAIASKFESKVSRGYWVPSIYGVGIGYLLIATGITAGSISWSTMQLMIEAKESTVSSQIHALLVARCILWAITVLIQGMLCGVLSTTLINHGSQQQWSGLIPHELDAILPSRSSTIRKEAPLLVSECQRRSIDSTPQHQSSAANTTRRSNRYSGRTLFHPCSKPDSLDLSTASTLNSQAATPRSHSGYHQGRDDNNQTRPQPLQRCDSEIKQSLDSVMLRPSLVRSSSAQSDATIRPPPKLKLPDESNIHPLFRSDSQSPPPTATPNTMVLASPDAGQTITVNTLQRMRSTRSVGTHTPRSRSPLFDRAD